jgi:hypothetical protein
MNVLPQPSQHSEEQVRGFFNAFGSVTNLHMLEPQGETRIAFVEFQSDSSIANALRLSGTVLGNHPIQYARHCANPIVLLCAAG